ncbi:hypothetical protein HD806DRAFT_534947 [Xylariaceae sp. AK1471]|nr:hypothetical protein HD806DRAFT_534947 [Xylariaceae sp. AK1471]
MKGRRRAEFRENLLGILQFLFAILVFVVFVLAFVIQSEGIILPQWTKTFQGVTPEQQNQYAAALLSVILVITAIIVAAGVYLARHVIITTRPSQPWKLMECLYLNYTSRVVELIGTVSGLRLLAVFIGSVIAHEEIEVEGLRLIQKTRKRLTMLGTNRIAIAIVDLLSTHVRQNIPSRYYL